MSKPAGYRYGSWLVLHGSGVHLVGFSTACWLSHESSGDTLGLWSTCRHSKCSRLSAEQVPDWLVATRVLACLSVALVVLWLAVGCQCRCLKNYMLRNKWMTRLEEFLAITAGCSAYLAVGVTAVESAGDPVLKDYSLSWSLWLVVGGVSAITTGGFIVAITRKPAHPGAPKPSTRTIGPSSLSVPSPDVAGAGGVGGHQRGRGGDVPPRGGSGVGQRHRGDITDIFNISSFTAGDLSTSSGDRGIYSTNNNSSIISIAATAARRSLAQREQPRGGTLIATASSFSSSSSSNPTPYCWTHGSMLPPPYSLAVTRGHTTHGLGGVGIVGVGGERQGGGGGGSETDGPATQQPQAQQQQHQHQHHHHRPVLELSLSPPPPYESVVCEPPPPYQQSPPVSFVVQAHVPLTVPVSVQPSAPPDSEDCGGSVCIAECNTE